MIVGSLVVLAYIVVLVLNLRAATGKPMLSFQRPLSMAAAGLYLIQVLLGMSLLGEGKDIPAAHFLIALLAIFSIGAEHMLTGREVDSRRAGRMAAIANAVTLAIVLIAYIIGETNGS
jgi:heme A synthase